MKVSEYLSPHIAETEAVRQRRRRGRHACQVAVDTIAYGQNIPFRLLMIDKLLDLPGMIERLVRSADGRRLLEEEEKTNKIANNHADLATLYDPELLQLCANWVLSLATTSPTARPRLLCVGWERAILRILPHVERDVWLTELGNPLPVHALARMLEHWALYVLFWCYVHRDAFDGAGQSDASPLNKLLGVGNYCVRVGAPFEIAGPSPDDGTPFAMYRCVPVVGPFWETQKSTGRDVDHEEFVRTFNRFVANAATHSGWEDAREIKPSDTELRDALQSRVDLSSNEADLRANSCQRALVEYFFNAEVSQELACGNALSRADWEMAAGLCCWLARWDQLLREIEKRRQLHPCRCKGYVLQLPEHDISLELRYVDPVTPIDHPQGWQLTLSKTTVIGDAERLCSVEQVKECILKTMPGVYIDSLEMFFNRTRERQNAAWTAQIIAVNNLINSHGDIEQIGDDDVLADNRAPLGSRFEDASHLVRGYGGRVCHYLLSMARADVADIYWLDYAQSPPRLVHAGGYARMLQHRVRRQEIHQNFDEVCWNDARQSDNAGSQAGLGILSMSQAYRVTATLAEDPPEGKSTAAWVPTETPTAHTESSTAYAYFDSYVDPKPVDAMAFPLLVNGRVVGSLTLAGLNNGQFDRRLFVPLRRVANLLAQTMYQASQLWQMRQLNWLVTHLPFAAWRQHDEDNQFNPLKKISACLTNVFLCRAVHIWLKREDDDTLYELHGYNIERIFRPGGTLLRDTPLFEYLPCVDPSHKHPTTRAFVAFGLDIVQPGNTPKGVYVQARYSGDETPTPVYDTANALAGMRLNADYLTDSDTRHGCFRKEIFSTHDLNDMMAFALLQISPDNVDPDRKSATVQLAGGVTLHDSYCMPADAAKSPRPWPTAWAPVVAHVQTYLPYLLSQVELLHNPLDHVRRFLLHAGRSELLAVRDNIVQLRHQAKESFDPDGVVRRRMRELQAKLQVANIPAGETFAIEQHLNAAWAASTQLVSDSFNNNLAFMVKAIERHRDVAELGVTIEAGAEWVDLEASLEQLLTGQQASKKSISPTLTGFSAKTEVHIPPIWWEQIAKNLIENAGKYARDLYNVTWTEAENRLRFENHARFDSTLDTPERLLRYGVRGSAARAYVERTSDRRGQSQTDKPGFGIGLWGVQLVCELSNVTFTMQVNPLEKTISKHANGSLHGLAAYRFDLVFDRSTLRRSVGGAARY